MKKNLILILFFLFSCVPSNKMSFEELDFRLSEHWIYATNVLDLKYNNQLINRPPGTEQLVMSLVIPDLGGLSLKRHCVYYTVPYKEKVGRLRVSEIKNEEDCPMSSEGLEVFVSIDQVNNLKISFTHFKLNLEFDFDKTNRKIDISLHNVEDGLIHERYQAMRSKSLKSGLKFLRLSEDSFDYSHNKFLGKMSDRFSRGSAIRCHQVNSNCETLGENRCEDCRYGWYEVVDYQCPQGGSKFCGQNHCGEKNEPACPRGIKVVDREDAGICQSDLEPVLNADKILVCQ